MYKDSKGEKPIEEIADELGKSVSLIRKWKSKDKWD
ncbi:terminase, partial [Bacillus thuringiensis]